MNPFLKSIMAAIAAGVALTTLPAHAEYPDRPIRTIVPFAPGGNADVTARLVTQALSEKLGQTFVIENRAGAGGLIGGTIVARAEPDGYTIMSGTGGPIFASSVVAGDKAPYTLKDLQPIGRLSTVPLILAVNANSPYRTFADFAEAAKTAELRIGHAGNATTNHVSVLQLQRALDTRFVIVPYKGSSPSVQDLLGAQIDAVSAEATACLQYVESGRLRALAIIGDKRLPGLPDVPTIGETGVKGVDVTTFAGMMAPAQADPAAVDRLSAALSEVLADPALRARLEKMGGTPAFLAPKEFSVFLAGEQKKYVQLVKEGLIKSQ